jgi:hypothetical protein
MRARGAVQEHGLRGGDGHIECADVGLAVLERNVTRVDTAVHGLAGSVGSGLSYGVVAVAELELHDVADCCDDGVWNEGVLGSADDDWNDLVLTLEGASCGLLVRYAFTYS